MLTSSKIDLVKTFDPVRCNNRGDNFELERPCQEIKSTTSIPYATATSGVGGSALKPADGVSPKSDEKN